MKKTGIAIVAWLTLAGCGDDPRPNVATDSIQGAAGEAASAAGFAAIAAVVRQASQTLGAAAGTTPGASLPEVKPVVRTSASGTSTGFVGPFTGPDGTAGWYKQIYSHTETRGLLVQNKYELFLKADPEVDLATAWPKRIKKLSYAWVGTQGHYAGYHWTSDWIVFDATHVQGNWKLVVKASDDPDSYAKYWVDSHFEGTFDLAGEALGNTTKRKLDVENRMHFNLHVVNTHAETPRTSDWYGAWTWNISMRQAHHYAGGVTTISGPFRYEYTSYWGQGADPEFTGLPAYSETALPPGALWADADAEHPVGLYQYAEGMAQAGSGYSTSYGFGFTEPTYRGTCSAKGTSLSYRGGKACVLETIACRDVISTFFAHCPR